MEEGFDWSKNPRPAEDVQDLEVLDPGVVPDLDPGLDPDLEAAVTKADDPNLGADLGPILLRIDLGPKAEPQDDLVRGPEIAIAMMMRAKTEIAAILAKGLARGLDPALGPGPDPDLDLEVTRTKETKKRFTLTKQMRNNQRSIHEYFLWQFTLNNDFWKNKRNNTIFLLFAYYQILLLPLKKKNFFSQISP